MNTPASANRFSRFLGLVGSAIAASSAVERGAQPTGRDLRRLGIDAEQFRRIGR